MFVTDEEALDLLLAAGNPLERSPATSEQLQSFVNLSGAHVLDGYSAVAVPVEHSIEDLQRGSSHQWYIAKFFQMCMSLVCLQ